MVLLHTTEFSYDNKGRTQEKKWVETLAFWCMNPGVVFSEVVNLTRCIVLTSGTLSPVFSFFFLFVFSYFVFFFKKRWIRFLPNLESHFQLN